jgi:undecaprenol kinase/diacylglycerol kinase (ATP)
VERFVDILKPRLNEYSQIIKDMMAAAVFLAAGAAALVGFIIFYPYIHTLLG